MRDHYTSIRMGKIKKSHKTPNVGKDVKQHIFGGNVKVKPLEENLAVSYKTKCKYSMTQKFQS